MSLEQLASDDQRHSASSLSIRMSGDCCQFSKQIEHHIGNHEICRQRPILKPGTLACV